VARPRILVVDDERAIRFAIRDFLEGRGWEVDEAASCEEAQSLFRSGRPDVTVVDYLLPDGNALDLLPRLKAINPAIPLVILTAHGSIDLAVRAVKEGAEHFLTKPVDLASLAVVLERALELERARQTQLAGRSRESRELVDPFVGTSAGIRRLAEDARKVLDADSPILLRGETGTGKGILALWLHRSSPRGDETFVDVNCAGLSRDLLESELFGHEKGAFTGAVASKPGLLEVAHRGTVFLDEIGDTDLQVQGKLLKVLEEKRFRRVGDLRDRRVDIRLVAATHRDLGTLVRESRFRTDLYFRISTIVLVVPALRERPEDIPVLARQMLERLSADIRRRGVGLTADAEAALQAYAWPGNVRELRNVLERALLLSDRPVLAARDLRFESPVGPESGAPEASLTLRELERRHIERVLRDEGGHVSRAARRLGTSRSSLYQKIRVYGIRGAGENPEGSPGRAT
jgi:DNA-binding NtrC family response regulator